jgi:hypothetical protein
MIVMHDFLLVVSALAVVALVGIGLAGLVREWTPPWGRPALRPRLWGLGTLLVGVGLAGYVFRDPLYGEHGGFGPVAVAGWAVLVAGLGLQGLGLRPGRTAATKSSS